MKTLRLLCLLLLCAAPAAAQVAVTGNVKDLGASAATSKVRFTLENCGSNTPRVNGTAIMGGAIFKEFTPDGAGAISGNIYGNHQIECGGATGDTRWRVGVYEAGRLLWPAERFNVTGAFNLNTAVADSSNPAAAPDTAYTQIQDEGTARTKRSAVNFIGPAVSCVDNSGVARTDCTVKQAGAFSITLLSPVAGDTNKVQHKFALASTLTRVSCSTDTGTVTIQFDTRAEATPNTAGTNALAAGLVCDSDSQATTTFSAANIAAAAPLNLQISATTGSPGVVRIHIEHQPQ